MQDEYIWNAKRWLAGFNANIRRRAIYNMEVYRTTLEAAMQGFYFLEDGTKVELKSNPKMAFRTKMYRLELPLTAPRFKDRSLVRVLASDCLAAAKKLVEADLGRVAVLNMASDHNPGGGVKNGSGAQEEYLFRCSDYYKSLYQYVPYGKQYGVERKGLFGYPLEANYGGIYSPGVTVFRGTQEEGYPFLAKAWQVDMLAVPGVNTPLTEKDAQGKEWIVGKDLEKTRNKLETILRIAMDNDVDILVLGAIGCGAYHNPPEHIALLFKELLTSEEYKCAFKQVVFAIKQDHNSAKVVGNKTLCEVFKEVLAGI